MRYDDIGLISERLLFHPGGMFHVDRNRWSNGRPWVLTMETTRIKEPELLIGRVGLSIVDRCG